MSRIYPDKERGGGKNKHRSPDHEFYDEEKEESPRERRREEDTGEEHDEESDARAENDVEDENESSHLPRLGKGTRPSMEDVGDEDIDEQTETHYGGRELPLLKNFGKHGKLAKKK